MNSGTNKPIVTTPATREGLVRLLSVDETPDTGVLFRRADDVRKAYCGDEVHLRGIIEFSNICRNDCFYCGLRRSNDRLERYRMSVEEIIAATRDLAATGLKTVVLQSGEDEYYTAERVEEIIKRIKATAYIAVTLSLGERSADDYRRWYEAGADRYLLKQETMNREQYRRLHPGMEQDRRLDCLRQLKSIGYQLGAGNIIGLPGQTLEDIADDILFLREIGADMAGISPFVPHEWTPLGEYPPGSVDLTLRALALARVVLRDTHLPATTALNTLDGEGYEKGLAAGANVVMANVTPEPYRKLYDIYPGKSAVCRPPAETVADIRARIEGMGRTVARGYGHSLKSRELIQSDPEETQ